MDQLTALQLLDECTGDDIWSTEHCRLRKVPEAWIAELSENYESGFQTDADTIYLNGKVTNQYRGIRDVELAVKIAEFLGIELEFLQARALSPAHLVKLIREAVEEG